MELFKLFGSIAVQNDEANRNIDETTNRAEGAEGKMSGAFKKIGAAVAAYFTFDAIKNFGQAVVTAAAEVSAEASAFEQIMGDYSDKAKEKMSSVADATGVVDTRLTGYMTSMTAKFKGLGFDIEDATTLASDGLTLASDAAAFWDKSLDDSMGALNSFINGSYEGGEAIGLFANDTQMAQYAVQQGLVQSTKDWADLDEKTKQATRLEYAENMMKMSGATGQAAKESDQYANVQANLAEKWRQFKAQIGEPILQNLVIPAMSALSDAVDVASQKFQEVTQWVNDNKDSFENLKGTLENVAIGIGILGAAWGGISILSWVGQGGSVIAMLNTMKAATIGNVAAKALDLAETVALNLMYAKDAAAKGLSMAATVAHSAATKGAAAAQWLLNAALDANPIGIIIGLIVALVAAFIYFWNTNEDFRNKVTEIWNAISDAIGGVIDWFMNTALPAIQGFIDGVGNFFTDLGNGISDTLSSIGDFFSSTWESVKSGTEENFNQIKENMGTAMQAAKDTVDEKLQNMKTAYEEHGGGIQGVAAAAMEGVKGWYSAGYGFIDNLTGGKLSEIVGKFQSKMGEAKDAVSNKFSDIKNGFQNGMDSAGQFVQNGMNSVKNFFSNGIQGAYSTVSNVLNNIKNAFSNILNGAANIVKGAIDRIKGFFNFQWKLPNLKLPHPRISGEFSLNPPSVPSFSIDWYAKGAIFDEPTLFPTRNGMKGVGEAGAEAVTPIDVLLGYVRTAVKDENRETAYNLDRLIQMLASYLPQIIISMDKQLVLDTGVLVGGLADQMDAKLGDINRKRERGQ